jgi:rhodanese-related sulfurtransferase
MRNKANLLRLIAVLTFVAVCSLLGIAQGSRSTPAGKAETKTKLAHPEVARIPAKELAQLIKSKAEIVIVDTQSADGYEMWHIPSAINITYDSTANPTDRQLMLIALPMDKLIVIYCLCEEGTDSAKMALELRQLGYSDANIKVLEDGLVLWDEKGYPMKKQAVPE